MVQTFRMAESVFWAFFQLMALCAFVGGVFLASTYIAYTVLMSW